MAKKTYYQRPDGLYETSRTINGKRIKFRGRTVKEVDRKILEYNAEKKVGRKFPVVADAWEKSYEDEVAYGTWKTYVISIRRLQAHFTGPIGQITPLDVKRYLNAFEQMGYSKGTVSRERVILKMIFDFAVLAGDIDVNPAAAVSISRHLPQGKRSALTEEQEILVERCRKGDWWLLGLMLLYTGCRRGELLALDWQDIDREAGVIHITKKLNYAYGPAPRLEYHLKSANGKRDIPLLQPLAEALPRNRIGKIFPNSKGEYLSQSELSTAWDSYCKDAGLTAQVVTKKGTIEERPAVTPHCFRHSFSTICYEAGIDPKAAAAFLGDTESIMRDVYTELRARHKLTSADKVNDYLEMRRSKLGVAKNG